MIYVYKCTSPSGNCYIGITNSLYNRKCQHKHNSKDPETLLHKAINKYGFDNIKWEIIDIAATYEVAYELERRYILHFDTYNGGYNMTPGGEGNPGSKENRIWDKTSILTEANKYKTRLMWHKNNIGSYVAAKRFGNDFFEYCCEHMITQRTKWNKDNILKEARKYNNINNWKLASNGSLKAAMRIGSDFYKKCKEHMDLYR